MVTTKSEIIPEELN